MSAGGPHIVRAPRPARGYEILPHSLLRDIRLSFRAIGLAARLLTNADGYRMPMAALVDEARRAPGKSSREGRDALRAALRELCEAGYVEHRKTQDARGRWRTETWIYDTPTPPETGFQAPASPTPENPTAGEPDVGASGLKSSRTSNKIRSSSMHAASAAAPVVQMSHKLRRRHASTGLVYWYSDELAEIAHLVSQFGTEAIQATAAAVACSGKDPLPRVVEKELQRQQRAIHDAVEQRRRNEVRQQAEVAKRDPDR